MTLYTSLLLFAIAATVTPGPNNIMILSSGMNYGIRRSLPHWLGICLGAPAMLLILGLGLGSLVQQWPWLHLGIKLLGSAYLIWLAWKLAITPARVAHDPNVKPMSFWQAVLFQWVNPKAWVMGVAAIAAFIDPGRDLVWQMLIITCIFLLVGMLGVGLWLFAGKGLQYMLRHSWQQRAFNVCMALLLLLSLYPMLQV